MKVTAISREQYQTLMQSNKSVRRTEPRATIWDHLVKPFVDSEAEMWAAGVDEISGAALPITWQAMAGDTELPDKTDPDYDPHYLSQVTEMVEDKAEKVGDAGISNIIALINRQDWNVRAEKVTNAATKEIGFVLVNPKVREANRKAEIEAAASKSAANESANADKAATKPAVKAA